MADFESLLEQFNQKKSKLAETETLLKKIYGKRYDFEENNMRRSKEFRRRSSPTSDNKGRKRGVVSYCNEKDKSFTSDDERDSPDDESPSKKPSLSSAIISKPQYRSRIHVVRSQNVNTARNKRLFSSLVLGTLKQFEHEEKSREKKSKRAIIESKIEQEMEKQKIKIKLEKEDLIEKRKQMKTEVRCIEKLLERAESFEVYNSNLNNILNSNCMITKSEPPIFFNPASHSTDTKKCLEESKAILREFISEKKIALETDLSEIKESYRKDSVLVNEENKCLKDENELQDLPETGSESIVVEQEDTLVEMDDESTDERRFGGSLEDQDFEPIYD